MRPPNIIFIIFLSLSVILLYTKTYSKSNRKFTNSAVTYSKLIKNILTKSHFVECFKKKDGFKTIIMK